MKTFKLTVDTENFDEPEILIVVLGYSISEDDTLEVQDGWNVGEPINDPCDDECIFLANRGGISETILVLLKNGYVES